jgi:hypothetical protein
MPDNQERRALRMIVWASRAIGWILIALAILSVLQTGVGTRLSDSLRLLASLALGLLGLAWLSGVELFLRFFDRFLSRN